MSSIMNSREKRRDKLIKFITGPSFRNMAVNIVIRLLLYCLFFTSEFIAAPSEPFVVNYHDWQALYSKPMKREQFCSDLVLIIVCSIVPIVTFGIVSACLCGSNKGFNIAVYQYKFIMSLAIVFAVTGLLTDIIKNSVGRLRPDYLSRCFDLSGDETLEILPKINVHWPGANPGCNNTETSEIRTGRRSFPSGHASISTSAWLFLSLSLRQIAVDNLQLNDKKIADISMALNFTAVIMPFGLLVPLVISISRFTDNRHHPTDIMAGAALGAFIAYSVYQADQLANRKRRRRCPNDDSLPLRNDGYQRAISHDSNLPLNP